MIQNDILNLIYLSPTIQKYYNHFIGKDIEKSHWHL